MEQLRVDLMNASSLQKHKQNLISSTLDVMNANKELDTLKYVKMGGCQHLRHFRAAERLKTAELRKRIMERNKKHTQKNDSVPFKVMYQT
ncbi:unnamed protein product [Porites lobata]|uniref:Uncharacterized protein n=1 Tax=Porites lobata TaxID=104759 RepID=A0ABN8RGW5_9CNID|nr:unnamed protein product [Porites lobata]